MTDTTNSTNTHAEQAQPVYQVQAKPNGVWVDVDAEQYADYSAQLSRYQVRTLYTTPMMAVASAVVLDQLHTRVKEMQEAAYTFGEHCKEAVSAALDGVLDVINEQAQAPVTSEPAQDDEEESPENGWRRLALQFDGHRMQALHHLRAMTQDPAKHMEHALAFLSAGPLPGEVVLAQRVAAIARKGNVGKIFQALTDRGEVPLDELRCVLEQIKENSTESHIVSYTDDALAWLDVAQTGTPPVALDSPSTSSEAQLQRLRAAFHVNMLRAFPDMTHEQIAAEIARSVGAQASESMDDRPTWADIQAREKDIRDLQSTVIELRQALEGKAGTQPVVPLSTDLMRALGDARELAMRNTVAARIPECGDFGAIAQNLDWAVDEIKRTASGPIPEAVPAVSDQPPAN